MTKHLFSLFIAALTLSACGSEPPRHAENQPEKQAATEPTPTVSELGIEVTQDGLSELRDKVSGREDTRCSTLNLDFVCVIGEGSELYIFSMSPDGKTQTAMFRGYVRGESGDIEFQQRGWFAGDKVLAGQIFDKLSRTGPLPEKPMPK